MQTIKKRVKSFVSILPGETVELLGDSEIRVYFVASEKVFQEILQSYNSRSCQFFTLEFFAPELMEQGIWSKKITLCDENGDNRVSFQQRSVKSIGAGYIEFEEIESSSHEALMLDVATLGNIPKFYVTRLEFKHKRLDCTLRVDLTEYADGDTHIVVSLITRQKEALQELQNFRIEPVRSKISEYFCRYDYAFYDKLCKKEKLDHLEPSPHADELSLLFDNLHPESKNAASTTWTLEEAEKAADRSIATHGPSWVQMKEDFLAAGRLATYVSSDEE